jgi:hypothetical protein
MSSAGFGLAKGRIRDREREAVFEEAERAREAEKLSPHQPLGREQKRSGLPHRIGAREMMTSA